MAAFDIAKGQGTLWLKKKIRKNRNGEEREVFSGSIDMGGGKMVKVQIPAELYTVTREDRKGQENELLPAYVSKWKSTGNYNNNRGTKKQSW